MEKTIWSQHTANLNFPTKSLRLRRPGYFYLFGENRDWNSRDNLKIFGKVKKFWAARSAALNLHIILKICF